MRKGMLVTIGALALAFPGGASGGQPRHVAPLAFTVTNGHPAGRCSRPIPYSLSVAVWVYVNGRDIHSGQDGGAVMYYAGNDTMVKLRASTGNGPTCATAITWLPHARVRVQFQVL